MSERFEFQKLTAADLPLLHEWLNRPHVACWWEGAVSLAYVEEQYGADLHSELICPMLAWLGESRVGFIQWYRVMGADPEWWTDETDPGARGIDQFLADPGQLGQGLGSRMVNQFLNELFTDPEVSKVQTDPAPSNHRAIRAYEKAGFRRIQEVITPDGPALLMRADRASVAAATVR